MKGEHYHSVSINAASLRVLNETILDLNDPARDENELFDCLVSRCRSLIPHSTFFVVGTDRRRGLPTNYFGPWAELAAGATPLFHRHWADHSVLLRHSLSSVPLVDEVSSHVSQRQWRSTGMYDEVFRLVGAEDQLSASQPLSERFMISLVINRNSWGFRKEESAILGLLLPHVVQAWRTRTAIRHLKVAAGTENRSEMAGFQLVVDSFGSVIEFSDEHAFQHLWGQFRESRRDPASQLPSPVRRWLRDTLKRHFRGDESSLQGRLSCDLQATDGERFHLRVLPGSPHGLHVVSFERRDSPEKMESWKLEVLGLSPRRAEVLYWVAEGKSNEEIAIILGISIHTVKNHLKAVYGLLLVENRHAATLAAWRVLRGVEHGAGEM